MYLYRELLNMFDQLHEGSEDPQIQTVCCIKRATILLCCAFILFCLLMYYHLFIQSFITFSHLSNVLIYFLIIYYLYNCII